MTLTDYTVQREAQMAAAEFIDVLNRSTLGQRRPIDQPDRIQAMLDHADLIVAARQGTQLVRSCWSSRKPVYRATNRKTNVAFHFF